MAMAVLDLKVLLTPKPSSSFPSSSSSSSSSCILLLQRKRIKAICRDSSSSSSKRSTESITPLASFLRPLKRRIAVASPLLLLLLSPTRLVFHISGFGEEVPAFSVEIGSEGSLKGNGTSSSEKEKDSRSEFIDRVDEAIRWLENGKEAQARGDFQQALLWYTQVVKKHGDLALSEYARVGRAISLYEVGDREDAFIEMEDVSISLKGYPEIHAALAAALYADKHSPVTAEQQFTIATLLDPNYIDLSYVKDTKHWPPNLLKSFERFINFK